MNSASNGILLPSDRSATYAVTESIHNGGHLDSYYEYVNDEIKYTLKNYNPAYADVEDIGAVLKNLPEAEKVKIKTEICNTLTDIKSALLEGELKIHN